MRSAPNEATVVRDVYDWRDDAACKDEDLNLFFTRNVRLVPRALAICARCPVRVECLEDAIAKEEPGRRYGIRGGMTERVRGRYARARRKEGN